ncbi:MAG: hypothetical protein GF307_07005 [candidate division Zixibacteria bacterium]|nr:hypothetical protein [candidate division Zixibacteria bacterium]
MALKGKKGGSPHHTRLSREERTRMMSEGDRRVMNIVMVIAAIVLLVAIYFSGKQVVDLLADQYYARMSVPEKQTKLIEPVIRTAASFGVNPEDIRKTDFAGENEAMESIYEVKISSLYPKMIFHRELIRNLSGTEYDVVDCVESGDEKSLDFTLKAGDEDILKFRLTSSRGVSPQASRMIVILDKVQAQTGKSRTELLNLGVMYSYILKPGSLGFTDTREALEAGEQQIIYEIPFDEGSFTRLMNAAASIVGLRKARDFDQAFHVMQRLAGKNKYVFWREGSPPLGEKLAEKLGGEGYVMLSDADDIKGEVEIFTKAGGKLVKDINWIEGESEDRIRLQMLDTHRKMLLTDNWGIVLISVEEGAATGIKNAANQLSKLNCKVTPVSQYLLRI